MNPKIVKFTPIKSNGNILGFCGLQVMVSLNGKMIPMILKAKVVRNSQTGHIFVTIHQESYEKPDGTKGYSNLANFNQEDYKEFNEAAAKAWGEFQANQNGVTSEQNIASLRNSTQASQPELYPHGMARNMLGNPAPANQPQVHKQQRQYKDQDEELPF